MKKLLLLSLISGAIICTTANAQNGPSPSTQAKQTPAPPHFTPEQQAQMIKDAKEKQTPMLVEKAGLTTAQADRVIEINYQIRFESATTLQGLTDTERATKLAEMKAAKEKKYSEIPLSPEQIKAVYAAYEEMGKNMKRN